MPIRILSDDLAAKIAAGEVIERPASVVKELLENALDSGARDIRIEVRGGGQRLIRVADDGEGIPTPEVPTAFARHGTSKLQSADDLFALRTLGFRGEALPSLAAVARVTMITRTDDENSGTLYKVEGSQTLAHQPQGAPRGTVVTVEDLFRAVPARLKFLKAPGTEAAHITELIHAYALAYSHVRFSLVTEGKLLFQSTGNGRGYDVLLKVFGVEVAREMIEIAESDEGPLEADGQNVEQAGESRQDIRISGYVSPPSIHRGTRKLQYLFVNGRWVEDRSLSHAVVEAYHTLLMVGRFPLFVLNVQLPPDAVDVNVHPTKTQVRFRDSGEVYRAVQKTVRRALNQYAPIPSISSNIAISTPRDVEMRQRMLDSGHSSLSMTATSNRPTTEQAMALYAESSVSSIQSHPSMTPVPMLRVLGQIASTYIIAEGPDGLYLVDQHAAHERVLYDQFQAKVAGHISVSQALLEPLTLDLGPAQWASLQQHQGLLEQVGFDFEPFGGQTLIVRSIPGILKNREPRAALVEILDEVSEGKSPLEKDTEARLITAICKGAAIKGGQLLSLDEMRALIRDLENTSSPRTCPHGRPTMVQLNMGQLEREFGRRG